MIDQNYGISGNKRPTTPNAPTQGSGTFVGPGGRLSTNNQYARIPGYDDYTPIQLPSSNITVPYAPPKPPSYYGSEGFGFNRAKVGTRNPNVLGAEGYGLMGAKRPAAPPPVDPNFLGSEGYGIDRAKNVQERTTDTRLQDFINNLPALSPAQQQAYRTAVRSARRQFEMIQDQARFGRRSARREFREGVRDVNRQQIGGSEDLGTALSYLGMTTSPATMGVGLQDIERQADIARAMLARSKADTLAGIDQQVAQGRIDLTGALSLAEQNKLNAEAANAAEKTRLQLEYF